MMMIKCLGVIKNTRALLKLLKLEFKKWIIEIKF